LIELFNDYQKKDFDLKDIELMEDIETSMRIIQKFDKEDYERFKFKIKRKSKAYDQKDFYELGLILLKQPVCIGIDFYEYQKSPQRPKDLPWSFVPIITKMKWHNEKTKRSEKIKKQSHLEGLKFFLTPPEIGESNDRVKATRLYLTVGLFDFLQRLLAGRSGRPRKCSNCDCGNWFIAKNIDKATCGRKCSDAMWLKKPASKKIRRVYMKDFARPGKLKGRRRKRERGDVIANNYDT